MALRAEIITVGNEILTGHIVNSNAAALGVGLQKAGIEPRWVSVVGDEAEEIAAAVVRSAGRAQVVVVTGGLGPTPDDVTREGVAAAAGRPLVRVERLLDEMRARWQARGLRMPESNERQALVPEGAEPIRNRVGSAPGFRLRIGGADVYVVPGVPAEMAGMFDTEILPGLRALSSGEVRRFRILHAFGWAESKIAEVLAERMRFSDEWSLAYLPHGGGVDLRVGAAGPPARVNRTLARVCRRIREVLGPRVYGVDDETLEGVVGGLLRDSGSTLAVAESCTGGLISDLLTNVPGSSAYFDRSVVAYSNRAKVSLLGVSPATLRARGAVSAEVAVEMARGVRRRSGTKLGLSVTGIAGPGGGTESKPVGLVYIGLSAGRGARGFRCQLLGGRRMIKRWAARWALNLLRLYLLSGTLDGIDS